MTGLIRISRALLMLPLLALPAAAQSIPPKAYPAQTIAFPDKITATRDIVYSTLPGFRPLALDLYEPAKTKGAAPKPLLVFVHGGGWTGGNARENGTFSDFPSVLAAIAARGFVVASVNYRLSGEAPFPAPLQDVKTAIRWLRSQADAYGIDTTRVAVWGASTGGQLAALVGTTCGVTALDADPGSKAVQPSACVQGVIDWYGVTDLDTLNKDKTQDAHSAEAAFLGCVPAECAPGIIHATSPISYIEDMGPAFLIQQGVQDTTVPLAQSQAFYDALHAKNIPAELVLYPGVGHGFAKTPFAPDPDTNKKAVEKVESFLVQLFPPKPLDKKPPPTRLMKPVSKPAAPKPHH